MNFTDITALVVLSVLWGGSFFLFEILLEHWSPFTIVTLRVAIAAIILWIVVICKGVAIPQTQIAWFALVILGLLNNAIPFTLIVWGQTHITSGLSSILNATTPFFTVIVAGLLLSDERMSLQKIIGVLFGIIGTAIMIGPDVIISGLRSASVIGQIAVLGAALSYALAGVWARKFKTMGISPLTVAAGQTTSAAILLLPFALLIDAPLSLIVNADTVYWVAMIALALFSTALAYILYFRLIASAGATNAALVTFLIPISAIALGTVFLNEPFELLQALGMAVIMIGLFVIDGRLFRMLRS